MNWLAQVLAAASTLLIGFLWYHPKTFGTAWMAGVGMTEEKMAAANPLKTYGLAVVMAFLISIFVASVGASHVEEVLPAWQHFAFHGAQIGVVMAMPILVTIFLFERVSLKVIAINVGYWIVALAVMGAIIGAMPAG
jgi:hypothetical protein